MGDSGPKKERAEGVRQPRGGYRAWVRLRGVTSRCCIVNLHTIDTISDDWGYTSIGTQTLAVSRSFKDELVRRLNII